MDTTDQAGVLGYHDRTSVGKPLGKVFAGSDRANQSQWSVSASHELLEMLVDPDINLCAVVTAQGKPQFVAYECADACESDADAYKSDGVWVSDFVFPSWFETFGTEDMQYDRENKIRKPLQTLAGGYVQYFDVASGLGWQQAENPEGGAPLAVSNGGNRGGTRHESLSSRYAGRAPVGSRRERRRIDRDRWVNSGNTRGGPHVPGIMPRTGGPHVPIMARIGGPHVPGHSGGPPVPDVPIEDASLVEGAAAAEKRGVLGEEVPGDINGGPPVPGQLAEKAFADKKPVNKGPADKKKWKKR